MPSLSLLHALGVHGCVYGVSRSAIPVPWLCTNIAPLSVHIYLSCCRKHLTRGWGIVLTFLMQSFRPRERGKFWRGDCPYRVCLKPIIEEVKDR